MELFLDIETNSAHSHIWMCVSQVGTDVQTHIDPSTLRPLLESATKVVAHNGIAFDFHLLGTLWGLHIDSSIQVDTLVLSRLLKPDREGGHSLDSWGNRLGYLKGTYKNWDNPVMDHL